MASSYSNDEWWDYAAEAFLTPEQLQQWPVGVPLHCYLMAPFLLDTNALTPSANPAKPFEPFQVTITRTSGEDGSYREVEFAVAPLQFRASGTCGEPLSHLCRGDAMRAMQKTGQCYPRPGRAVLSTHACRTNMVFSNSSHEWKSPAACVTLCRRLRERRPTAFGTPCVTINNMALVPCAFRDLLPGCRRSSGWCGRENLFHAKVDTKSHPPSTVRKLVDDLFPAFLRAARNGTRFGIADTKTRENDSPPCCCALPDLQRLPHPLEPRLLPTVRPEDAKTVFETEARYRPWFDGIVAVHVFTDAADAPTPQGLPHLSATQAAKVLGLDGDSRYCVNTYQVKTTLPGNTWKEWSPLEKTCTRRFTRDPAQPYNVFHVFVAGGTHATKLWQGSAHVLSYIHDRAFVYLRPSLSLATWDGLLPNTVEHMPATCVIHDEAPLTALTSGESLATLKCRALCQLQAKTAELDALFQGKQSWATTKTASTLRAWLQFPGHTGETQEGEAAAPTPSSSGAATATAAASATTTTRAGTPPPTKRQRTRK